VILVLLYYIKFQLGYTVFASLDSTGQLKLVFVLFLNSAVMCSIEETALL